MATCVKVHDERSDLPRSALEIPNARLGRHQVEVTHEMIGYGRLVEDLARIGIKSDDALLVHSSLKSIGRVEGGPETVIQALLEILGPDGLLVMPTFTYRIPVFEPERSESRTGRITEVMRSWPTAVRSWHPTHSVAAIGAQSRELCRDHHRVGGIDIDSPLDRLAKREGKILLIGVGHIANSTIHLGEAHAKLPYLDIPMSADAASVATVIQPTGERLEVSLNRRPGCSRGFGVMEKVMRDAGAIRDGMVGAAPVQWMGADAVVEETVAFLRADPAGLLCTDPHCYRCTSARMRLKA